MDNMRRTLLLFTIIIIEGYVVLSTELLAIREIMPFVGSGTDTVSIIIAAVLMPLAVGYFTGGHFKPYRRRGVLVGIRRKLVRNFVISQIILICGLSYATMAIFFGTLHDMDIAHRLVLTSIYAALFVVTPVYLLGQTIPLISNYFPKEKLSRIAGRILFFSTLGSFLGATFSTLVLMSTVGVHNTASLNFVLLAVLVILLSKHKMSEGVMYAFGLALIGILLNSNAVMGMFRIVENNVYSTIMVYQDKDGNNQLLMNNMGSSLYNPQTGQKHLYIEFLERQLINPIRAPGEPKDILVVGAGAFTLGLEDTINHYEYVDIDGSLQRISEDNIIKQKLTENKKFTPMEARAFFNSTKKKYDVIVLDAYLGDVTLPEHLVTREFFQQVADHLKDNGIVAANFIVSPSFESPFSRHVDNTLHSVFPQMSRHVIMENYKLWNDDKNELANVIYFYKHHKDDDDRKIYTDDLNRIYYDKPQKKIERHK